MPAESEQPQQGEEERQAHGATPRGKRRKELKIVV
jgi:hypothetical protein